MEHGYQSTAKMLGQEADMGLRIKKLLSGLYEVSATPPHVKDAWTPIEPLRTRDLIKELQMRGCHQQDIGDALYEQDPNWEATLDF